MPYGDWVVAELKPAEGYLANGETYAVTVNGERENVEISVVNDRVPELGTTATAGGEKQTFSAGQITIEDTVT